MDKHEAAAPGIPETFPAAVIHVDGPGVVQVFSTFTAGDLTVEYLRDGEDGQLGLRIYPAACAPLLARRRDFLDGPEVRFRPPTRAWRVDPLVQIKCAGGDVPDSYAQGRTMRNAPSALALRCERQSLRRDADGFRCVETVMRHPDGWRCVHELRWDEGDPAPALEIRVRAENTSAAPWRLDMLGSFSLGGLTPFHHADAPGRLWAHCVRSYWSAEGRVESVPVEQWLLEGCWQSHSVRSERFGQVGTLPVRGWFPFAALEDREAEVTWGAQLDWSGSWQMEFYRRGDCLSLSGGLADREFGHWQKVLAPGEILHAPTALLASVRGGLDDLCRRLNRHRQRVFDRAPQPAAEADLPLVANEFCTSWGNPTHDNVLSLAHRLRGSAVRYLVIDAGWYADPGENWSGAHGDWQPSAARFPDGLAATAAAIRAQGLVPGLWFELETCGHASRAFHHTAHLLHQDGEPVSVGGRRFWNLADPWVWDYLGERVIGQLRAADFGYLKVDYNETLGLGCDGWESPGEGLRRQVEGSRAFFRRLRAELPDLVIENCASGGHRLEPGLLALTSMSSFSDAHETPELPLIAANLHRMLLPRQSQIWAVLRRDDDARRMTYSLAASLLGRMCVSGELHALGDAQWETFTRAQTIYRQAAPTIARGESWHFGPDILSYRHPVGWQAVVRVAEDGQHLLAVVHGFARAPRQTEIVLPAAAHGNWCAQGEFAEGVQVRHEGTRLHVAFGSDFAAAAVLFRRTDRDGIPVNGFANHRG